MSAFLSHLLSTYGYWIIAAIVGFERVGVPFPAATILIFAGAFADRYGMNINLIVAAACVSAIVGNIGGFFLGKTIGYWVLFRYGHLIGLNKARMKLGQYLFMKYGTHFVVLGQFFPVFRELGGFLSGVNRRRWRPFLIANTVGALFWSATMGFGAYFLGKSAQHIGVIFQVVLAIFGAAIFMLVCYYLRTYGQRLQALAEESIIATTGRSCPSGEART